MSGYRTFTLCTVKFDTTLILLKITENASSGQNFFWKTEKKVAFSKEYGYVWTGPQGKRGKLKPGTGRKNKIDYHTKFTNQDRFIKGLCRESTSGYIAHNYLLT